MTDLMNKEGFCGKRKEESGKRYDYTLEYSLSIPLIIICSISAAEYSLSSFLSPLSSKFYS